MKINLALVVFVAMAGLDFVWAKYTSAMVAKQAVWAGSYASLIILLSGIATLGYTHDPAMLGPAMAGAFVGTYLAVRP